MLQRILDPTIRPSDRGTILRENKGLVAELVGNLCEKYRETGLREAHGCVYHIVTEMHLPPLTVLEIKRVFSASHPKLVEQALLLNINEAISYHISRHADITVLPRYLGEYYTANLPLYLLKATLLAAFARLMLDDPQYAIDLLTMLFPCKQASPELQQKMEEVSLHVSRHVYELASFNPHGRWIVYATYEILTQTRINLSTIQTILSWIPRADNRRRAYVIDSFMLRIRISPVRGEYVEETLLLEEEFHELRISRLLNRRKLGTLSGFAEDPQNVHVVRIEDDVMEEIEKTLGKFTTNKTEDSLESLRDDPKVKPSLETIEANGTIFYGRTLKQWLLLIYGWAKEGGHMKILVQELQDMSGACASGHFRRLINVMNGIAVDLKLSDHDIRRKEFFDRTNQRIQEHPDCDEILQDIPRKARELANQVAREMLREDSSRESWDSVLDARQKYLWGE